MLSTAATYLVEGTSYNDSADTTIYIPETTSRTFKSVFLELVIHDATTTYTYNLSAWGIRGSCDAGSTWTSATVASGYATSGENMSHVFVVDMTAEFVARFSGASDTFRYGFYMDYSGVCNVANVSAKLYITYEYDDTAHATRVKTVRIPIESLNGRLSNSAQEVKQASTAANQLPALLHASTPFLPENSVTIRQAFCELWTKTTPSATTDSQLYLKVDSGGSETTFGLVEDGGSSPITIRYLYNVTSTDWTSAHALYARHNNASESHYLHLGGWLTVTYEYNHTNSSTILNSVVWGMGDAVLNVRTSGDVDKVSLERWIEEPATITLVQSGVFVTAETGTTSGTLSFGVGSQTVTGYTPTAGATDAGFLSFMHRIDAGGHRGAGVTLARGKNTFTCQFYASNNDYVGNVSALMILNYTSGKHANGDGVHNHSVYWGMYANNAAATANAVLTTITTPSILESNYYLQCVAPVLYFSGIQGSVVYFFVECELQSGEGEGAIGAGWFPFYSAVSVSGNERKPNISFTCGGKFFRRYPNTPDTKYMELETTRSWRYYGVTAQFAFGLWVTYHSITFTVSGTVSGYTGDGSGLTVKLYRTDNGAYLGSATTAAGGGYTFTWYDNTIDVLAECRQDATHVGRSDNGVGT
jgi:hypothetical protein